MTVSTDNRRFESPGNGVTLVFAGPRIFSTSQLAVYRVDNATLGASLLTIGVDYTVAGVGDDECSITMVVAPPIGSTLLRLRTVPYSQTVRFKNQGAFLPELHENMADLLAMQIQQLKDLQELSIYFPETSVGFSGQLPSPTANYVVVVNPANNGLTLVPPETIASLGASFLQAGAGAQLRTVQAKLRDIVTVEDYGAVGDGVTNDSVAFLAMAAANGGRIVMLDKEYFVGTLTISGHAQFAMIGAKQPRVNATFTELEGGTILIGRVDIRCNDVLVENFGVDSGSARGLAITEGFVIDAVVGQLGNRCIARNLAVLGADPANPTHALLIEGFEYHEIENVYVGRHRFGVVSKNRNGQISHIDADQIDVAACYLKADVPASAGNVLNAAVSNVQIHDVQHRAAVGNTTASAVYIHASTAAVSGVQASKIRQTRGYMALRVQGPGTGAEPVVSGVIGSDVSSDSAQLTAALLGFNFDCVLSDLKAVNPVTGSVMDTSSGAFGWIASGLHVLISDVANLSVNCANFNGTGQWDNFTVRNPYRTMIINGNVSGHRDVITGQKSGEVIVFGEGNITPASGATAEAMAPAVMLAPNSIVKFTGRMNISACSGTAGVQFATMPIVTVGGDRYFACAAKNDDGTFTTVPVKVSTFVLSIEVAHSAMTWVDLSNITFKF